jgi:hypothetical protein
LVIAIRDVVVLLHSVIDGDIISFHFLLSVKVCSNGLDCVFASEWTVQMSPMFDVKKFVATYHHKLQFNSKDFVIPNPNDGSETTS